MIRGKNDKSAEGQEEKFWGSAGKEGFAALRNHSLGGRDGGGKIGDIASTTTLVE